MGVLDEYERPGGAHVDHFEAAKQNQPDYPYSLHVVLDEVTRKLREVWLNTEVMDFDGLIIGYGEDCVADAIRTLERTIEILKAPPSPDVYRVAERT